MAKCFPHWNDPVLRKEFEAMVFKANKNNASVEYVPNNNATKEGSRMTSKQEIGDNVDTKEDKMISKDNTMTMSTYMNNTT